MTEDYQIHPIFPTPVLKTQLDIDISKGIEYVNSLETRFDHPEFGEFSKKTRILHDSSFENIKNQILKWVDFFAKQVLCYDCGNPLITQSWITIKKPFQNHQVHHHSNSIISGVFYFEENEGFESIKFYKQEYSTFPNFHIPLNMERVSNSEFAWTWFGIQPKKNTLVLFPSNLKHGVDENKTNVDRRCLAFNCVFEYIGSDKGLTLLHFNK